MRGTTAVRQRVCPACAEPVAERTARWCGTCGALLVEPSEPEAEPAPAVAPGRWHRLTVGAGVVVAAALLVVAADAALDRASPSTAVPDVAVATPDADTVRNLERRTPPPVPAVTEPTCLEVADRSCFLWVVEADGSGFDAITVTDELLISEESLDGLLVARALRDGLTVWTAEVERGFRGGVLRAIDDLVVHVEDGDLTGRELATGEERWRTDALGRFAPFQVGSADGVLVVAGESLRATSYGGGPPNAVAAGLDPSTGELLWREEGDAAYLAAGGVTVIGNLGGSVRAYGPAGDLRWERDGLLTDEASGFWAVGHAVTVYDEHGRAQLHRLRDGAPLDLDGSLLVSDDRHSFVELQRSDATGGFTGHLGFALLDEDGEVWQTDGDGWSGCLERAELEDAQLRLTGCSGTTIDLDRADGTEVGRSTTSFGRDVHGNSLAGPFELSTDGFERTGGVVVTDVRTDTRIAVLPPETQQLWRGEHWWQVDLGGVTVLQSRGWLSALPLPRSEPGQG